MALTGAATSYVAHRTYALEDFQVELPRKALAGVIAHGPVVSGVAQSKAQSGATRGLSLEVALQEDVRPVSAPDFDASDLRVARAKAHVREQLCRLPPSETLFR
jgi:hypothetical protein